MQARNLSFEYTDLGGGAAAQLSDSDRKQLGFRTAERIQQAVTAKLEKRALVWMAGRMPAWINSDHLTALGFAAQFLAGVSYALAGFSPRWLVATNLFIALNWFGDSLDGTLARVRNQQRPRYGYYVDHVLDSAGMLVLFGGMAIGGYLAPVIALATLVAYYFLSIEVYLATYALGT